MAWHRTGDKSLSEAMMALFPNAYARHLANWYLDKESY